MGFRDGLKRDLDEKLSSGGGGYLKNVLGKIRVKASESTTFH